jgi:hypothetical protein
LAEASCAQFASSGSVRAELIAGLGLYDEGIYEDIFDYEAGPYPDPENNPMGGAGMPG